MKCATYNHWNEMSLMNHKAQRLRSEKISFIHRNFYSFLCRCYGYVKEIEKKCGNRGKNRMIGARKEEKSISYIFIFSLAMLRHICCFFCCLHSCLPSLISLSLSLTHSLLSCIMLQ